MSTIDLAPQQPRPFPAGTVAKDSTVSLRDLHPNLYCFLQSMGAIHRALYAMDCVVTSANDGKHLPGSKHMQGKAVDLRISDKSIYDQGSFIVVCLALARKWTLAVFDESNVPGAGHVHIEIAG